MHEMALAEGILDIALDYGKQNEAKRIAEVGLLIGEMSGVEQESLRCKNGGGSSVLPEMWSDRAKVRRNR